MKAESVVRQTRYVARIPVEGLPDANKARAIQEIVERAVRTKSVRVGNRDKMLLVAYSMMTSVSNRGFDRKGAIERIVCKLQVSSEIVLVDVEELAMWQELLKGYRKKLSIRERFLGLFSR